MMILRVFRYQNEFTAHKNPDTNNQSELSERGLANLKIFFSKDFEVLTQLFCFGKIQHDVFIKTL